MYDIISGPDRCQGSGVSPAAGGENFWAFFSPSKHTIYVCIYIYIYKGEEEEEVCQSAIVIRVNFTPREDEFRRATEEKEKEEGTA